jgi:hypothetical protein
MMTVRIKLETASPRSSRARGGHENKKIGVEHFPLLDICFHENWFGGAEPAIVDFFDHAGLSYFEG